MAEELGKIEKPAVEDFKKGRKLFFVPLIYRTEDSPEEYLAIFTRYWEQVAAQINELSTKLGKIKRVYHELVAAAGDEGYKAIEGLSENSHRIALSCREKQAELEALEDSDILTEFMDWSRCLLIGLQNPRVVTKVYEAYQEAARKRTEQIAAKINETLKANEIGLPAGHSAILRGPARPGRAKTLAPRAGEGGGRDRYLSARRIAGRVPGFSPTGYWGRRAARRTGDRPDRPRDSPAPGTGRRRSACTPCTWQYAPYHLRWYSLWFL
jgi:hypothetical protein